MSRRSRIMASYGCSQESADYFIELRAEGYSVDQAALMAGISDPPENAEEDAIPLSETTDALEVLGRLLSDLGGCDHSAGICLCEQARALDTLRLALERKSPPNDGGEAVVK